ncbi:MAG: Polysaccharide biosynthesis protein [Parcubacteria group bacterium ADurb.Bin216]|nr:MAG: Polysaccharide biosynthesis protein [Parcubacteria group bacterium ADurb.Bin216]
MVKRILKDDFLRNNIVYFIGTVSVAFLNYLYHPVLGRMLKVEEFGEVQAFLAFFLIIGVFTGFFRNVIITAVANIKKEEDKEIISMLKKASLLLAFFVAIFLLAGGHILADFFNFSSYNYFIAFAILVVLGAVGSNSQAIIQGMHDFKYLSLVGIVNSLLKLLASVLFIYLGWAVFGAIGGIILSTVVSAWMAYVYVRKRFNQGNSFKVKIDKRIKKELWYAVLFLAVSFSVIFLYSNDVVMMKRYFSAEETGLYSGIAIVGRVIYFLVASIPGVLLPAVKIADEKGENRKILVKAICLTGMLGGGALLVFSVFPELVSGILMGDRYQGYAHFIPQISLYLFFVSFSNLFFYYLLALRKNYILLPAVLGPLTVLLLCFINHSSVEAIVNNFLGGSILTFLLLLLPIIKELLKKHGK